MKKLTKNDYEILRVMVEEGTTNSRMIAEKLNLTDKTVRNRRSIMKELGVFKRVVLIDPKIFGYSMRVDFFLKVNKNDIDEVANSLMKEHKHLITYIGSHWGDNNISMQCVFKTGEDGEKFQKILASNPLIEDFKISIVPTVFKDVYDWRPDESNFSITKKAKMELDERRNSETRPLKDE